MPDSHLPVCEMQAAGYGLRVTSKRISLRVGLSSCWHRLATEIRSVAVRVKVAFGPKSSPDNGFGRPLHEAGQREIMLPRDYLEGRAAISPSF